MKKVTKIFSFFFTSFVPTEQGSPWLEDGGIHTDLIELKINYIFARGSMSIIKTNLFS